MSATRFRHLSVFADAVQTQRTVTDRRTLRDYRVGVRDLSPGELSALLERMRSHSPAVADLTDFNRQRRDVHRRRSSERRVDLLSRSNGEQVIVSKAARETILLSARMNRGVETAGLLFAFADRGLSVRSASEPGPNARCGDTWHRSDDAWDVAEIERMAALGYQEVGSWHSHPGNAAPPAQLAEPSPADLARWSGLRKGERYVGLIVETPPIGASYGPVIRGWVLSASSTGVTDVVRPVALRYR